MKVCSLTPSATEIAFAIGGGPEVVAVSHTCDFPTPARNLPVVTRSLRGTSSSATELRSVFSARHPAQALFALDAEVLRSVRPELILTQDVCDVCAIGASTVFEMVPRILEYEPTFVTVRAGSVREILINVDSLGEAMDHRLTAASLRNSLLHRIEAVLDRARPPETRVLALEWLRPLRAAGLWIPELIEMTGGVPVAASAGQPSEVLSDDIQLTASADVVAVMPCGYDIETSRREFEDWLNRNPVARSMVDDSRVFIFDGRVPSRHGPRIVDVLESLTEIIAGAPSVWQGILYEPW